MESEATWHQTTGSVNLKLRGIYRYTRATNSEVYSENNQDFKGKQLILTPIHSGSLFLETRWHKFTLLCTTAITGRQFTDADNSSFGQMGAYITSDVWVQKQWGFNTSGLAISGGVNNILNATYEARPGYPMPGRNYMIRMIYEFNQK